MNENVVGIDSVARSQYMCVLDRKGKELTNLLRIDTSVLTRRWHYPEWHFHRRHWSYSESVAAIYQEKRDGRH